MKDETHQGKFSITASSSFDQSLVSIQVQGSNNNGRAISSPCCLWRPMTTSQTSDMLSSSNTIINEGGHLLIYDHNPSYHHYHKRPGHKSIRSTCMPVIEQCEVSIASSRVRFDDFNDNNTMGNMTAKMITWSKKSMLPILTLLACGLNVKSSLSSSFLLNPLLL